MRGYTGVWSERSNAVIRQRDPSSDLASLGHLLPQGEKDPQAAATRGAAPGS